MSKPFRPQSRGDELHATPRRLAATPISTLGTSTDLSLTEMATPIKPETQDGEIDYESGVHGFSEGIAIQIQNLFAIDNLSVIVLARAT